MNIYIIRLLSGAEIICSCTLKDETKSIFDQILTLKKPLRFGAVGVDENGRQRIGFVGHVISDPECEELILNGKAIESYIEPCMVYKELKKEYKQQTSAIQLI